jgi:hypothetical protein
LTPRISIFGGALDAVDEEIVARTLVRYEFQAELLFKNSENGGSCGNIPQLGLFPQTASTGHLDTLEGLYWLQLEWRALAQALRASGSQRNCATRSRSEEPAARCFLTL